MDKQLSQAIEGLSTKIRFVNIKKRSSKRWSETAERLYNLKKNIESLEIIEKELVEELKILSKGETSSDGIFCYAVNMRKGSIDYNLVSELENVDLEPYRRPEFQSWKLTKI